MKNRGYYGRFGGAFIPEILVSTFEELVSAFEEAKADPHFWREYETLMKNYLRPALPRLPLPKT